MYWHFKLDRFRATDRLIYNNETKLLNGLIYTCDVVWRFRPTMRFQWKNLKIGIACNSDELSRLRKLILTDIILLQTLAFNRTNFRTG